MKRNLRQLSPTFNTSGNGISDVQVVNAGNVMAQQFLKNPVLAPKQIVLSGAIPADDAHTYFFFADALGLATDLGLAVASAGNGIAMTPSAGVGSTAAIQKFLQSYAIVVKAFNFNTTDPTLIENALKAIYASIDGDFGSKTLFASDYVSAVANNPNLLNVNIPFVWTFNTILRVPVASNADATTTFTYTFKNLTAVPYGMLNSYLDAAKIVDVASNM